ncbi:hypothetical protein [Nostoc sp. FACHB-110]|uniref:hypothetical protein n=1 Tax=Nostoc sp. FACHB-110 TaxID=2692834 RepID=UPI001685D3F8|nr:hypothetical protein [Nostoc sp. FACHB-110]MBD2438069.1 hypothetical protein [Nostoc sp. FACHB-110]
MATINITDLRPAGSTLFFDGESYLEELSDDLTSATHGGVFITLISPASPQIGAAAVGAAIASAALTYNIVKNW